ncbi:MAG TPA: hypothetical protein EYP17_07495 [Candidatus Latescibacteria bacterium]|nr:hypothetical protein [Candidatus Latescibacterota bacterium]
MKVGWIALMACVLVGGLAGMVYSHVGPDIYIPQVDPARITIDGLGTEWEDPTFYPQEYMITPDDLGGNVTGGDLPPADDWYGILYLGWSAPPDNMLYGYSRVTDDILNDEAARNGDAWRDDTIEIIVDADHSGGNYREGWALHAETAQQFCIRMTQVPLPIPIEGAQDEDKTQWHIWARPEAKWVTKPEYMYAALDHPETRENCTYAWEWKMALWDEVGASPEESKRHINKLGDCIGLVIQWDDSDAELDKRDDQPGTQGPEGNESWTTADHLNDAYFVENPLLPPAVEASSWGVVKASFK